MINGNFKQVKAGERFKLDRASTRVFAKLKPWYIQGKIYNAVSMAFGTPETFGNVAVLILAKDEGGEI